MDDMLQSSYAKTLQMVTRNRAALDALVEMLLDKSRISGDEVRPPACADSTLLVLSLEPEERERE